MTRAAALPLIALPLVAAGGCIVSARETEVRADEPRLIARFESDDGLARFQRVVRERAEWDREVGGSAVVLPFVVLARGETLSRNAFYNDQLAAADVDADGLIRDAEVDGYCDGGD